MTVRVLVLKRAMRVEIQAILEHIGESHSPALGQDMGQRCFPGLSKPNLEVGIRKSHRPHLDQP